MSTIKLLYFARLRDELGCGEEVFQMTADACTVGHLKELLMQRAGVWQSVFSGENILVAVNKAIANAQTQIAAGDEVGFFPPVTGG